MSGWNISGGLSVIEKKSEITKIQKLSQCCSKSIDSKWTLTKHFLKQRIILFLMNQLSILRTHIFSKDCNSLGVVLSGIWSYCPMSSRVLFVWNLHPSFCRPGTLYLEKEWFPQSDYYGESAIFGLPMRRVFYSLGNTESLPFVPLPLSIDRCLQSILVEGPAV